MISLFPVCEASGESWRWVIHQQRLIMGVTLLMLLWIKQKEIFGRRTREKRDGNGTKLIHEGRVKI